MRNENGMLLLTLSLSLSQYLSPKGPHYELTLILGYGMIKKFISLIYNIVLISAIEQSESYIYEYIYIYIYSYIYTHIFFFI